MKRKVVILVSTPQEPHYPSYQPSSESSVTPSLNLGWQSDTPKNVVALWAFGLAVLGIVGVVFPPLGIVCALVALVLAIMAILKARRIPAGVEQRRMGMSVVSLVLSAVALIVYSALIGVTIFAFLQPGVEECMMQGGDSTAIQECISNIS